MSVTVTVNGQPGPSVVASTGDTVTATITAASVVVVTASPAAAPGGIGPSGPANTLKIGTVTSGTAAATITGTAPSQTLNLVLPAGSTGATGSVGATGSQGPAGPANSLSIGTVTSGTAAATIAGTAPNQTLNLVLQKGDTGAQGPAGATGPAANLADETPQPLGTASAGTALSAARADHVHSQGSIAYSGLSGIPSTFAPSAHAHAVSDVTGLQTALDGKQASGTYATLVSGTVPSSQLPGFVDDVQEYTNLAGFPATGEVGKLFVARDSNKVYRWSGSTYIEIAASPGSTDSVTEGSTNLYHTNTRAAAAAPVQSVSGRTGTITVAQLGTSGTASSTTFLRGDGQWSAAGLGANDSVDGGFFTGQLTRSITITVQPVSQTMSGGAATFSVTATVSPSTTMTYQWQRSNNSGATWADVSGATSYQLSLSGLTGADSLSRFRVIVSAAAATSVTSSEAILYAAIAAGSNSANFNNTAVWGGLTANVTTVGTNGGPSAYGTYDQNGNVQEWNDLDGSSSAQKVILGSSYSQANAILNRQLIGPDAGGSGTTGLRVATRTNPNSYSGFVSVGDAGNSADGNGYGAVGYAYSIGQHEVTVAEFAAFLNAVGATNGPYVVNPSSITRSGTSGSFTYSPTANMSSKPFASSTWFTAARYCNWLHNGKPSGAQDASTTESGAYTLSGAMGGSAPARNADAKYHIPTEAEWYKAAYYKSGGTNAGYWDYATQSDTAPSSVTATSTGDGVTP